MDSDRRGHEGRVLTLFDCLMIGVGGMVGSAIFAFSGITILLSGTYSVLAWLGAGLSMFCISIVYGQMARIVGLSGGLYTLPRHLLPYGRGPVSFLCGWIWLLSGSILAQTISAIAAAAYTNAIFPNVPMVVFAVIYSLLILGANLAGLKAFKVLQNPITLGLMALLLVYVIAGLGDLPKLHFGGAPSLGLFFQAWAIAWLGYSAWIAVVSVQENVKNSERTVPTALAISTSSTAIFYALIVAVMVGAAGIQGFAKGVGEMAPLVYAGEQFSYSWGAWLASKTPLVPIAGILACLSTMNALMLDGSRVLSAMSREGCIPKAFGLTYGRENVPAVAFLFIWIWCLVGIVFSQYSFYLVQIGAAGNAFVFCVGLLSFVLYKVANRQRLSWYSLVACAMILLTIAVATRFSPVSYQLAGSWAVLGLIVYLVLALLRNRALRLQREPEATRG